MAANLASEQDSHALDGLRRRRVFLISGLLWAAAAGVLIVISGYALIVYHYVIAMAERIRSSFGLAAPPHGPDWLMLTVLASGPTVCILCVAVLWICYRRAWLGKLRCMWPYPQDRSRYCRWHDLPVRASIE
jgi:hypothetical protein